MIGSERLPKAIYHGEFMRFAITLAFLIIFAAPAPTYAESKPSVASDVLPSGQQTSNAADLKAQAVDTSHLPEPIRKLASEIQVKTLDEIRCLIIKRFGKPLRTFTDQRWDTADGVLTFYEYFGPNFHDSKSNKKFWLIKKNTKVEENIFAGYAMMTPNMRMMGGLTISPESKYSFKDRSANQDNYFARYPVGKVTVTYNKSVKPETLLESLEENATIAQLVFTSIDGEHSASYSIVSSKDKRSITLVRDGERMFSLVRLWKGFYRPPLSEYDNSKLSTADIFPDYPREQENSGLPEPIVKLASQIQEIYLRENKSPDEIRCEIFLSFGSPQRQFAGASSIITDQWDIFGGLLSYNPNSGPVFFDKKSERKHELVKTNNRVDENLIDKYRMSTVPDNKIRGGEWLGLLTIHSDFTYSLDDRRDFFLTPRHLENFFMRHPAGTVSVTYVGSVKPETLLDSLEENTTLAKLVFTSNDGQHSVTYSITSSKESRKLVFVGNGEMKFSMYKHWKNGWR